MPTCQVTNISSKQKIFGAPKQNLPSFKPYINFKKQKYFNHLSHSKPFLQSISMYKPEDLPQGGGQ